MIITFQLNLNTKILHSEIKTEKNLKTKETRHSTE